MKGDPPVFLDNLLSVMADYAPISALTAERLAGICRAVSVSAGEAILLQGEQPDAFWFLETGLMRMYVSDPEGREYTKVFFAEGGFPGSMVALLRGEESGFTIMALEDCRLIRIDFAGFRRLLRECDDLKWFQIRYLEENWVIGKEAREVSFAHQDAASRYRQFLNDYPALEQRLTQYQIAAHLGVTPTQLSRIRSKTKPD